MNWRKRKDVWLELSAKTGHCVNAIKYHVATGYLPRGVHRPGLRGHWYTDQDVAEAEYRCRIRGWMRHETTTVK